MGEVKLLPCPFCGSDEPMMLGPTCDRNTPYNPADRAFPIIRCGGCFTDVPGKDFDASCKSAAERWNNRAAGWLPIEQADKSVERVIDLPKLDMKISNSEDYWVRDAEGRVYRATWADDGKRAYWWDYEGESPVDPVEFMPHPLDPRFADRKASPSLHEGERG